MQHRAKIKNLAFILTSLRENVGISLASREALLQSLASIERLAFAYRQWDELRNVGNILIDSPLPDPFKAIGFYYLGHTVNPRNCGDKQKAHDLLTLATEHAPGPYQVRAILSLAAQEYFAGNKEYALELNLKAAIASARSQDLHGIIASHKPIAFHYGIEGDSRRALEELESIWPMVRAVQCTDPVIYFDYLNTIAVELSELGRIDQARSASSIALNSPFAVAYPEWHETAREIEQLESAPVIIVVPEIQPETQKPEKVLIIPPVANLSQALPKLLPIALAVVSISILVCKSRPARAPPLF